MVKGATAKGSAMENVTDRQRDLLARLRERDLRLQLRWDEARGVAASLRGTLADAPRAGAQPADTIRTFLEAWGDLLGPPAPARVLMLRRTRSDSVGWTHLWFQQVHRPPGATAKRAKPLEVYGGKLAAHVGPDGALTAAQSSCWREISVDPRPRVTARALRDTLLKAIAPTREFRSLADRSRVSKSPSFPLMDAPRLVVYPWQGRFRLAWTATAYARVADAAGERLELGQVFVDAQSGEPFLFLPTTMSAEAPAAGTGLGVTPLGGPFAQHSLEVVREGTSTIHRLKDLSRARAIITYDAACSMQWTQLDHFAAAISNGTLPVSENVTSSHWGQTVAIATRQNSQQPEVDAHFFCGQAYEWYDALAGGRAGWDDGNYADPPVEATLPIRVVTHTMTSDVPCDSVEAIYSMKLVGSRWVPFILFFDGNPTATCSVANDRAVDYMAGSRQVVGHEYQHGITTFSFEDGVGKPGLGYSGWAGALHEGFSDAFGCMFAETWSPGPEISPAGLVLRDIAFPRDPLSWMNRPGPVPCGRRDPARPEQINKDHFEDRDFPPEPPLSDTSSAASQLRTRIFYYRGTILAHCAFLMAQGGVHQRASRTPALIPVYGLGRETAGALQVLRAARIWYRALTYHFSTHGALTGIPAVDENLFRTFRDACVTAAEELYGTDSREHRTTALAFYAVGLQPVAESYGADPTFLRWGWDWRLSRPWLGGIYGAAPDWASLDLFINNGGASEWNAIANIVDAGGNATQYENTVYCRVRNVGDQAAANVQVQFFYAKAGTGQAAWLPVTDRLGNVQTLNIGLLAVGQMNFPESVQDTPPSAASVKWWIPPLGPGETVDHFCLKATVTADNDVNAHNNEVQSNIAYVAYVPGSSSGWGLLIGNPMQEEIPLEIGVHEELPKGWRVRIDEIPKDVRLGPGETRPARLVLEIPASADRRLEPPLDGEVRGRLAGPLSGVVRGALTKTNSTDDRVVGHLAVGLEEIGTLVGAFDGWLDRDTRALRGRVIGSFQNAGTGMTEPVGVSFEGWLRPWRRIHVRQLVRGEPIAGMTIQVQEPGPPAAWPPPPPAVTAVARLEHGVEGASRS
jgi:hypothetical protein